MGTEQEIVKIVIPSYHRADRCRALAIPHSVACVPQSEFDDYAKNYGEDRIVAHPDDIKGIGAKRQWIMDNFPNVFMIDDEYDHLVRLYLPKGSNESTNLTPEETYDVIQATASVAKEMGVHLFGFSALPNPTYYSPMKPFRLVVGKSSMVFWGIGILEGHQMFIPKGMNRGEDSFLNMINAYFHRFHLQDLRFTVPRNQDDKNGLSSGSFDQQDQNRSTELLHQYFGFNYPIRKKMDGTYDFDVKVAL